MTTKPQPPENTSETITETEEWRRLYEAFALLRKETDRALAPLTITVAQAYLLAVLDVVGRPLPVTELARAMLQESPSVTRLIDRMSRRGLVRRLPDSTDRRRSLVAATERGKRIFEQLRRPAKETSDEAFGVLSPRERSTFKRLLLKFTDAARQRAGIL
jgi:MarR family transcriptional regulator for hemolysin